ncbi:MAG: type II toxin-antitoxin system HicA family toxin [bacterium]
MKVRDLIKLLESNGWVQVRMKGSHRQFKHPSMPSVVTVAGSPNADIPQGTLNSIMKHAGLKKAEDL